MKKKKIIIGCLTVALLLVIIPMCYVSSVYLWGAPDDIDLYDQEKNTAFFQSEIPLETEEDEALRILEEKGFPCNIHRAGEYWFNDDYDFIFCSRIDLGTRFREVRVIVDLQDGKVTAVESYIFPVVLP